MQNNSLKKIVYFGEMILGTTLSAAAFSLIIVPQGFAAGGITGLSRIICHFTGNSLSLVVLILSLGLLFAGLVCIGWSFVAKTVFLSVLFPVMLDLLSSYSMTGLYSNPAISILLAGVLLGCGAGLILKSGASAGGFDIIALILNKHWNIPVASAMRAFDCSVILMQAIGQPLLQTVYGILVIILSSVIINMMLLPGMDFLPATKKAPIS